MTRLAEVKAERDAAKTEAWVNHMALLLALTDKPDHVERVPIPNDTFRYVITAYGLTRADGGYVIVRGICKGQRDTISAYQLDDWTRQLADWRPEFRVAAEHITTVRYRKLQISA